MENTTFVTGEGRKHRTYGSEVPEQCPLVLLVKVSCRQTKTSVSDEGKIMRSGLFEYAV
jgi:hypothetical protein